MSTTMTPDASSSPEARQLVAMVKTLGRCPPSLIGEDRVVVLTSDGGISFEGHVLSKLLDGRADISLGSESEVAKEFETAVKMAGSLNIASGPRVLEQRRCILLAIIGLTAESNPSHVQLKKILDAGFLVHVKSWLDDILSGAVGGIDLLLHLLSNISVLPVAKEMVTTSRLGKAVAGLEKHKMCTGSRNEAAIKGRVGIVKERWSASVKAMKHTAPQNASTAKRPTQDDLQSAAKKIKRETPSGSLSNLLKMKKLDDSKFLSAAETARLKAQEREAKIKERLALGEPKPDGNDTAEYATLKKDERRIRWADKHGKALTVAQETEKNRIKESEESSGSNRQSWSDRKKKDLLHEKELLLQARKSNSVDNEDKQDMLDAMAMMVVPWKTPRPLPGDGENQFPHVASKEATKQFERMKTVLPMSYASEDSVPSDPTPLSSVEQALEQRARSAASPNIIPFFTPPQQQESNTLQTNVMSNTLTLQNIAPTMAPTRAHVSNPANATDATLETVLMMGLPLFLVGSNIQALQTLAATPSLLNTFRDSNGIYDQPRLMNLVQTLTQNLAPSQSNQPTNNFIGMNNTSPPQLNQTFYQQNPTSFQHPAQTPGTSDAYTGQQQSGRGYRGDQNMGEANVHLSGYGPGTSNDEIIAFFAPYVHVVEVVQKSGFSFVNTRDPDGAKRAREALNGVLLRGNPVRINIATRKVKNPHRSDTPPTRPGGGSGANLASLPRNSLGQIDFDQVRDDRGNPSTKNLFVAGYGPGTTEQQLRELVVQHANVISVVMKGSFAFVNTSDRDESVLARESLIGVQVNGGALRINFAKESGRLGTSFDQTYGPASSSSSSSYGRFR